MNYKIINKNCLEALDELPENSIDCIITDPPYELNFMGKGWDNAGVSFNKETWAKCLRVLKDGGYLLAFGGTRTYHRIACAIEDAGFEIRDCIMWLYGSGFPKGMNIGLALDKKDGVNNETDEIVSGKKSSGSGIYNWNTKDAGECKSYVKRVAQNNWKGWNTALKPAYEPIIMARKSFKGSLVDNVLKNGVGGLNIDECRVKANDLKNCYRKPTEYKDISPNAPMNASKIRGSVNDDYLKGRFPANVILTYDETDKDEVCGGFPNTKSQKTNGTDNRKNKGNSMFIDGVHNELNSYNDSGSASRYFYCAKASKKDRDDGLDDNIKKNIHPTVKPTELMQYLVRLVAPKNATILDCFMGSGSTGKAVAYENKERNMNYSFIGIELDSDYCKIAKARIDHAIIEV